MTKNIDPQQKLVRILKHQIDVLSVCIIRLSHFYQGVSEAVDQELIVLRGHIGSKSNFALAQSSMARLYAGLEEESHKLRKQHKDTKQLITESLKQLQQGAQASKALNKQIVEALGALDEGRVTLFNALPHLQQAMALYQRALGLSTAPKAEQSATSPMINAISAQLVTLIEGLSNRTRSGSLNGILKKLQSGLDQQDLMQCCLVVVKAVTEDLVSDNKNTESFIGGLQQALSDFSSEVESSLNRAVDSLAERADSNEQLRAQVQDMEATLLQAMDMASLKQQASEITGEMSRNLEHQQQADKAQREQLLTLLANMKTRLGELEQQAQDYRSQLVAQRERLNLDALTELPNRNAYNQRVAAEMQGYARHQHPFCLAIIDVDHFKQINDNFGHGVGDKSLQVIAQTMIKSLRPTDFTARWGGEEFVVLLPDTRLDELSAALEQLREKISNIPFKFKHKRVTITASIGATAVMAGDSIESLFERADKALYQAKQSGRNRCVVVKETNE